MSAFLGQPRFPPCRKQMSLERIMKTNPFFDKENPITYKLYLSSNTELSKEEIDYYNGLIFFLEQEHKEKIDLVRSIMRDSSEVLNQFNEDLSHK